ncbi:MAG TPA: sigma-70 family RNA polymerase sigma factor [Candidatus Krumholzibacteria bacterium]|nr:sigma-70 family RNA polymerase sigma factor [Candidatus Krumholzibacteria bacterium]
MRAGGDDEHAQESMRDDRPRVPADVLEGVRRRDPEALGRFFDMSFPYVYRLAYRLTGRREAAEDLTHDVFLKVHRAADSLQTDRDPMPWLATITYNACRDAGRRASSRLEVSDEVATDQASSSGETPDEALLRKEREQAVQEALLQLDEATRTVIILHDYCGLSHEEAAVALNSGAASIRKRYSRGLKRLATIIGSLEL